MSWILQNIKSWLSKTDSRQGKKCVSPAHSRGNIWDATLSQWSNLCGILEEAEPEVDLVDDNQEIQAEAEDEFFGTIHSDIVGVRYYKGSVSNSEMVNLVREPMNKYDPFAMRVDNVTYEQVGYIKREHAKALSFVVDSNYAKVEGLIPFGATNKIRIPVVISLWGNPGKKSQALTVFQSFSISVDPNPVKRTSSGSGLGLGTSLLGHTHVDDGHDVSSSEMEKGMDQIFETLDDGDKTTEASPAEAIKTGLYPHQKQALNWMICRESKGILPPFWEKQGDMYINTLTICHTHIRPASVCGGILADDMGLGKTLEMISLILTNFVDRKPLALPVQGTLRCPIGFRGKQSVANTCSPNLSAQQAKRSTPLNIIKDEGRTNITPKIIAQTKSNYSTATGSSVKEISTKDPDFIHDILEEVFEVMGVSQGRRERKRPAQYCYSDEEVEKELKESIPNKVINLASCTKTFDDVKESKDLLKFPATQVVLTTVQDSKKENLEYNSVGEQIPDNLSFSQNSTGSELSSEKLDMDVVNPNKGSNTQESETKLVSEEILKMEDSLMPTKTLDSAEVIVIDDRDDNGKKDVAEKDCKFDGKFISEASSIDKKTPSDSNFLEKTGILSEKKLSKDVTSSEEPFFVVDSDDDDLPDIPTFVPETNPECIPDKLGSDYEAGTGRAKTAGPRGTLIICPVSVINTWVGQFEEHLHQQVHISLYVYYGVCRKKDLRLLREQDVVITTYSTLAYDFKSAEKSPLHQVEWLRLVLDEGHFIRNPDSLQAKAVCRLQARRKWVLTGTPIQNSMKDLWSLINFLGVKPFSDRAWWNRIIARPLAYRESIAMHRVSHLMRNLALRRTKNQQLNGRPLIALPERHIYLEKIKFDEEERAVYEAMQKNGQIIIGRYYRQGTVLRNYGKVLAILTRLRQLCCHSLLVASAVNNVLENNSGAAITEVSEPTAAVIPQAAGGAAVAADEPQCMINQLFYVLNSGSDQECAICLKSIRREVITACAHVYCRPCIEAVIKNEQPNPKCPLCRAELSKDQLIEAPAEDERRREGQNEGRNAEERSAIEEAKSMWPSPEAWQSSAKIEALMKGLKQLREQDPKIKSIVVSQFTSFLDLIEIPLGMQGFHFARLDGRMSASERVQAVEEFSAQNCSAPTVFLLSLKAGGVGINLTAANRVFLMDPAWNPAAEEQCFDRCHRLGQTKDVVITRFVIEGTVEERMLELQELKRKLMKSAFRHIQSREERRNNLIDMIRNLFGI